jgi:hypothetical protein
MTAFSDDLGSIRCEANVTRVPAWLNPGSTKLIATLSCGQTVHIVASEQEYFQIRIGGKSAYVESKYVQIEQQNSAQLPPEEASARTAGVPASKEEPVPIWRRHEANLNFEISNIYYAEPDLMRNKGFMYGISSDYTYRPNKFMFRMDGRLSLGNMNYWSNGTGTQSGIRDYNFETRFTVGYGLKAPKNTFITPFGGIGYRYLADLSGGMTTTSGASGYNRKSNYLYSPMGLEAVFSIKSRWTLGFTAEYDLFWHGWQFSELGSAFAPYTSSDWEAENNQRSGYGTRYSIKLNRKIGRYSYALEPYFRYWSIDDSDILRVTTWEGVYGLQEPANTTKEWGMKFGIKF